MAEQGFGWGIVGAGGIARQFAADLAHVAGARVAAVQSRTSERARELAAGFPDARIHADLATLLADPEVDAVYIATPNALHAEQALQAIAAGKPVLIEKPLAVTALEAREVQKAAALHGVFCMEAMWTRFLPAVARAHEVIRSGKLGEVRQAHADLSYFYPEQQGSRFFSPEGGGAALDLGVYGLSLALHFFGPPRAVSGGWQAAASGVDLRSTFMLAYPQMRAELSCGFDRDGANAFTVEGTKGSLRLEAPFLKATRLTLSKNPLPEPAAPPKDLAGRLAARIARELPRPGRRSERFPFPGGGLQFEAAAVMEAVREGRTGSDLMPLAESVAVLEIVDEIRRLPPI